VTFSQETGVQSAHRTKSITDDQSIHTGWSSNYTSKPL